MTAPVALFAYNRPDLLRRTLDALAENPGAMQTDLIVWSDGAKNNGEDQAKVAAVRAVLDTAEGRFRSVERHDSPVNRGLAASIIHGVTDTVDRYGSVIVLEDDLLPSPFFLKYMNDALTLYADCEQVVSIHAHFPADPASLPETFFLRGANCWGWATWKRGWDIMETDGRKLLKALDKSGERARFDYNRSFPYRAMLRGQVCGNTESWAIRWYAATFLSGKLTLNTRISLVTHTGYAEGTHFSGAADADAESYRRETPVDVRFQEPVCSQEGTDAMVAMYRKGNHMVWHKLLRSFLRDLTPKPLLKTYRRLKKGLGF